MDALIRLVGPLGILVIFGAIIILPNVIKVVQEWERGVIFQLGKYNRTRGPGLVFIFPFLEYMKKIDLRIITMEVPPQEVITRDNVTVKVSAVVFFRVISAENSVIKVMNYVMATSQISQTTLRSVLGQSELDDLLAHRETINDKLQKLIDEQTEPWGVKVTAVEIKDVELPEVMQRAMSKQAEAEREKRAKIIHAEGEYQAATRLAEAAKEISKEEGAMQLRYLQTLTEIAVEKSSTILFPVPIDTLKPFLQPKK